MTHLLRRLIPALLVAAFCWSGTASAAAPRPVVDGNRILDQSTSKRLIPRGVNFPGFEYACQQDWAYGEQGTAASQAASTAAGIASWKINTVRLPLNEGCWLGEGGLPAGALTATGYREAVEGFVDALNQAGIMVILDLHWTVPDDLPGDGLRPMPDSHSPAFWTSVATRFKTNRSVIFDLFNEPHSRWSSNGTQVFDLSWSCWANGGCQAPIEPDTAATSGGAFYTATGMKSLVQAVRATGADQPILLSGIDYANDLRGWLANSPADGQLIAGFHNYPGQRCHTTACWNSEIAPVAARVPVLAAEFGQNDCVTPPSHVVRFMTWADEHQIGYLAWAWWALPELGCSNYALVSDLDGTPLGPVGKELHDHLAELARQPEGPDPQDPDPDNAGRPATGPKEVLTVRRRPARLKIRRAAFRRGRLDLRVAVSPLASFPVEVKVRLASTRRTMKAKISADSGIGRLTRAVPAGKRPTVVIATYPGDQRLRPQTVKTRFSVSSLTRNRPSG